jgi:phosphatidylserine/phosphatidylglycerophosphate/cardiolipin synthase-like enzyme
VIFFSKKHSAQHFSSQLFNEKGFYKKFLKDLETCRSEVAIESPYVTTSRMEILLPVFQRLLHKKIKIQIVTRDPSEHENELFRHQATNEILVCKDLGIDVQLQSGFHHRKLAIIDRTILWEGSLNILSYSKSKEIMRRLEGGDHAQEMIDFLKL